jgi:hypothetical protein
MIDNVTKGGQEPPVVRLPGLGWLATMADHPDLGIKSMPGCQG